MICVKGVAYKIKFPSSNWKGIGLRCIFARFSRGGLRSIILTVTSIRDPWRGCPDARAGGSNCYILSKKRVVGAVGINNLNIVDIPDALLVADRSKAQDVKHLYAVLKAQRTRAASTI